MSSLYGPESRRTLMTCLTWYKRKRTSISWNCEQWHQVEKHLLENKRILIKLEWHKNQLSLIFVPIFKSVDLAKRKLILQRYGDKSKEMFIRKHGITHDNMKWT
jgi:hypothetical protein